MGSSVPLPDPQGSLAPADRYSTRTRLPPAGRAPSRCICNLNEQPGGTRGEAAPHPCPGKDPSQPGRRRRGGRKGKGGKGREAGGLAPGRRVSSLCPAPNSEPALADGCQGAFPPGELCCELRGTGRHMETGPRQWHRRGFNTPSPPSQRSAGLHLQCILHGAVPSLDFGCS